MKTRPEKDNLPADAGPDTEARANLLLEINNAIVCNLDLPEMLKAVSTCLMQVLDHDFAVLFIYDPEVKQLRSHALHSHRTDRTREEGYLLPIDGSVSGYTFASRKTFVFDRSDLAKFPSTLMLTMDHTKDVQSGCSVPLIVRDEAVGVLTLISFKKNNFNEEKVRLIENISSQVAIAVENARSYHAARRQSSRFEMLLNVSNALSAMLDLGKVLEIVTSILRQHIRHDFAGVALYDEHHPDDLRILALENRPEDFLEGAETIPINGTPDGEAFTTRRPVLCRSYNPGDYSSAHMQAVYDIGIRSFCCVPLISRGQAIGVLAVANLTENSLTAEDAETIQLIANQIAGAVESAVQFNEVERLKNQLTGEKLYLEEEIQSEYNFEEIIGHSAALKYVLKQIETVAPTDSCVLLYGETGTGKELISRAIHNLSERRGRTLVKLNCAAIPTGLLESELFGHEKGAFTGAVAPRVGRFELANKGTLLLDEIGDIPLELQPKLLRVLQESEFERLGSSRTQKTDVRLIAATNANLPELVEQKKFRSDLYYRLNVFPITIPPLRERPEDIPLLAGYFTKKHALRMCKPINSIPLESVEALRAYDFPGNVRELENFIERAVILTRGNELELPLSELRHFRRPVTDDGAPTGTTLQDIERAHIAEVLKKTGGVVGGKGGAAEILDLPISTLRHRMKKLGLR